MRFAYAIFILILAVICFSTWASSLVRLSPAGEAFAFIKDVQSGNLAKTIKHFGGNTCRCPKKEGWGSYLFYASGQEPNLTFLLGHDYELGHAQVKKMHKEHKYLLPWERPEDFIVDVPITFNSNIYSPLFLPLKMAYGKEMSALELESFLSHPDRQAWKGFTLRLRPSLRKGTVRPLNEIVSPVNDDSADLKEPINKALPQSNPGGSSSAASKLAEKLSRRATQSIENILGKEALAYLEPKDAGPVTLETKRAMSLSEVESLLPRLKAATLRLHVVRRGQLKNWTIYHFTLADPVLISKDNKELPIYLNARSFP